MIDLFDMLGKVNGVSPQDHRQANYKAQDGYGNQAASPEALPGNDEAPDVDRPDQHQILNTEH